jgi:allantoicase
MTFAALPDLVSRLLGGSVVAANDEFFAERDNLVTPEPPTFRPHTFGPKGQVYDGWETRRRRKPGHDHAIIRLGAPGIVRGVVVDTAFFTGNYPPYASVEACGVEGYPTPEELAGAEWTTIVARSALAGDQRNEFAVDIDQRFTHVRLSIYPDGGVARLRVHGEPVVDPRFLPAGLVDLAAAEHGGLAVDCSNMFYSAPNNLLLPGPARTMGEGWETARRRDDGNDWVVVRLAAPGRTRLAELDTGHFKGNAPGAAALSGVDDPNNPFEILPRTRLQPDTRHRLRTDGARLASLVRLDVYPDGGMARLRLFGELAPSDRDTLGLHWFNALPPAQARHVLGPADQRLVDARPLEHMEQLPEPLQVAVRGIG